MICFDNPGTMLIFPSKDIMNSVLKKTLLVPTGLMLIFALSIYLFPCIFYHDGCCESASSCDIDTCQCSCGAIGAGLEIFHMEYGLSVADYINSYDSPFSKNLISSEYYRPPETALL
jgi:hypothetical protein